MTTAEDPTEIRRRMAAPTARLIEFLRDLASARAHTVTDVDSHLGVHWLAALPDSADLFVDATAGDVLLALDPVASEPPPRVPEALAAWIVPDDVDDSGLLAPGLKDSTTGLDVALADLPGVDRDAFTIWLDQWQIWAEQDRAISPHRSWYESLIGIHQELEKRGDEIELVAATGLLAFRPADGEPIRTHLLSTRLQVTVDVRTARVEVLVDPDATTRIADRDLLHGEPSFRTIQAEPIRQRLRESMPTPLADPNKAVLADWRDAALDRCRPYQHDRWDAPAQAETVAELVFAPALVQRVRDQASLISYYDQMLEALSGPEAQAPLGLAQLLTALEADQRIAWLESEGTCGLSVSDDPLFPLPSNDEQAQVIERLRTDNGVVVHGPPGTGKSHSIANLIAALLARGMRVLVTSQKSQALRVLHTKLPPEIAELCVSMTDLARGGSVELNRSVNALSDRFANFDSTPHEAAATQMAQRRDAERGRVATLTEQIRALRESETYQHPAVADGYAGTLGMIGRRLAQRHDLCGWIPIPLPADAGDRPPLTSAEMGELRRLLAEATPQRRGRASQVLPDPSLLPSVLTVRGWIAAEQAATAGADEIATGLSRQIAALPGDVIAVTAQEVNDGELTLLGLDLSPDLSAWPPEDWRVRCLTDGLAGNDEMIWSQLAQWAGEAHTAAGHLEHIGLRVVTLPPFDTGGSGSLAGQLETGRVLRDWLAGGGELRKRFAKPPQRNAERLLQGATVDGVHPTNLTLLDLVLAKLEAAHLAAMLATKWAVVGVDIDRSGPLERLVARLVHHADTLTRVQRVVAARDHAVNALSQAGMAVAVPDLRRWSELVAALAAVRAQQEADRAGASIAEQVAALGLGGGGPGAQAPELLAAIAALSTRAGDDYAAALGALALARRQQTDQRQCQELQDRLRQSHPGLALLLERTASDAVWETRLATFESAWAWARARGFFDGQRRPGLDQRLDAELADAVARVEAATADVAAAEAWGRALSRMDATQAQALRAYRQSMADRGKGTGRYAHRYERAARQAMVSARDAVPAWIMPLPEVLETIPPDRNSFDVVIVDEASQASLESLFLLWLAPRVIVVGDDRQCTPSQVVHGELQPIFDKLEQYLPDIPDYLRIAFTPRSSLFSLLSTRFGSIIRLREHFRCMPEIIGWSSRQFYADSPLIPLRQFGAERLPPLRCTYVPGAYAEGTSTRLRNRPEAEALVDQVAACLADPDYHERTVGIVVLQGTGQIALIESLLHQRIPATAWEQRRLRVGAPPDFQGDERHIVFVSMVVAETPRAVTAMEWQRRFNVAASRAQDQLWLFHSVTVDALSPTDLRRSLLAYVANPPAPTTRDALDAVTDDDPHPAFDSLLEQRVFRKIRDRGFQVTPQFEVNGKRIDLVITGAKGRLAVECDGDFFHSSAEQRDADLHRELGLRRAGWKFWRVRESEFYFDPDQALSGLWSVLDARGIRPHDLSPAQDSSTGEVGEWAPTGLSSAEGADGLDDDPLGAAGLDAVIPFG